MKKMNLLKDYLGKKELTESVNITQQVKFHWANWEETCLIQRKLFRNFNNNFFLSKLNNDLANLKLQPIWLCNKQKIIKTDLYSLYESYLDSRLRLTWFERKEEILYSTLGEQGPYYTLTSMKWMEKSIYSQFVMRKILIDYFTLRSFRLNAEFPLVVKFDNDVNYFKNKVEIHQISEDGVILKFKDKNFYNKIKNSNFIETRIPVKTFFNISNLNLDDSIKILNSTSLNSDDEYENFILDSKILNFYGNTLSSKKSGEDEFFVFARYDDIRPVRHKSDLKTAFKSFVDKTKYQFSEELESFEIDLKAS